jgi:hypothetical protein
MFPIQEIWQHIEYWVALVEFTAPRRLGSAKEIYSAQEKTQHTALCMSMHENGGTRKKLGATSYISWLYLVLQHLYA